MTGMSRSCPCECMFIKIEEDVIYAVHTSVPRSVVSMAEERFGACMVRVEEM